MFCFLRTHARQLFFDYVIGVSFGIANRQEQKFNSIYRFVLLPVDVREIRKISDGLLFDGGDTSLSIFGWSAFNDKFSFS